MVKYLNLKEIGKYDGIWMDQCIRGSYRCFDADTKYCLCCYLCSWSYLCDVDKRFENVKGISEMISLERVQAKDREPL